MLSKRPTGTGRPRHVCSASVIAHCSIKSRNTGWFLPIPTGCITMAAFGKQSSTGKQLSTDAESPMTLNLKRHRSFQDAALVVFLFLAMGLFGQTQSAPTQPAPGDKDALQNGASAT